MINKKKFKFQFNNQLDTWLKMKIKMNLIQIKTLLKKNHYYIIILPKK